MWKIWRETNDWFSLKISENLKYCDWRWTVFYYSCPCMNLRKYTLKFSFIYFLLVHLGGKLVVALSICWNISEFRSFALQGISIYIQSYFFVETALKEEEQCIAVAEASREEQRQIVRLRNQSSGRLFCSTPTQYDESFEIVEFTESEENIVYPKSRWEKFWQTFIGSESLFASRYMRSQRRPHRRALVRIRNFLMSLTLFFLLPPKVLKCLLLINNRSTW